MLLHSTEETECKEIEKLSKNFKHSQMLLSELNLIDLPCTIFEDNNGAIFLTGNFQVSKCAKCIGLKHHFIRKFNDDSNLL